jgi:selenocysteine lyase/cysteine desulfurase
MLTELVLAHRRETSGIDFAELRTRDFARLDAGGHAYLDFTGSALYPERLVTEHTDLLRSSVLGNPHSESPASLASTALICEARARVLRFFDADPDEYVVCFTANTSGALQLVGSAFEFGPNAPLVLAADNHNSVNGIREYAARAGAEVHYLPLDAELRLHDAATRLNVLAQQHDGSGLFAFPAQSNFSGVQHPLSLVRKARSLGYAVLLDAAAFAPTTSLSLREVPADFVACSFYKLFGYPTGIGALVARRDALARLRRPWFAGGTVEYVSVQHGSHLLRDGAEGFEDGTPNFLAASAVVRGLDFLESLGLANVKRHTSALAEQLVRVLRSLRYADGAPFVHVYGPRDRYDLGATVTFNLLDRDGNALPYELVESCARRQRISVRGGCFCNPGASEFAFEFVADRGAVALEETRREGWTLPRFARRMRESAASRGIGAIRASLGVPSNAADVDRLVDLVESMRVD